MAKRNVSKKASAPKTHEGAVAKRITPEQELTRSVMACFLWEDQFYEDGDSIADRIRSLCTNVSAEFLAETAIKARHEMKLRHTPLFLLVQLLKKNNKEHDVDVKSVIAKVVSRVDELGELLVLYAEENGKPLNKIRSIDNQLKKGLAKAFFKFDEYQFGKYNKNGSVRIRDVIRLAHPKPENPEQEALFGRIVSNQLAVPDTWEESLYRGVSKKETFTRLLTEEKLGGLALLRNLKNMQESGVDRKLVLKGLKNKKLFSRVLPFRFLSASKHAPTYEKGIDEAMLARIEDLTELEGTTAVLVDCSGSMDATVSAKSQVTRKEAGAALGALISGDVIMIAFGSHAKEVPARKGMAGIEAIKRAHVGHATNIADAVALANRKGYDRIIVITDEQMQHHAGRLPDPLTDKAYFINVASYQNGVGYGKWTNISGFSEGVFSYIEEAEKVALT